MHYCFKTVVTLTVDLCGGGYDSGSSLKRCLVQDGMSLDLMLAASMIFTSEI